MLVKKTFLSKSKLKKIAEAFEKKENSKYKEDNDMLEFSELSDFKLRDVCPPG